MGMGLGLGLGWGRAGVGLGLGLGLGSLGQKSTFLRFFAFKIEEFDAFVIFDGDMIKAV